MQCPEGSKLHAEGAEGEDDEPFREREGEGSHHLMVSYRGAKARARARARRGAVRTAGPGGPHVGRCRQLSQVPWQLSREGGRYEEKTLTHRELCHSGGSCGRIAGPEPQTSRRYEEAPAKSPRAPEVKL